MGICFFNYSAGIRKTLMQQSGGLFCLSQKYRQIDRNLPKMLPFRRHNIKITIY